MGRFIYLVNEVKRILEEFNYPKDKRTLIQKVLYFSFDKENRERLFIPYLYGPYSRDIQLAIFAAEKEEGFRLDSKKTSWQGEVLSNVRKVLEFFTENEIKNLKDIANISKIHYLYIQKEIEDINRIKNIARFLSWLEIYKMNNADIKNLKKMAERIEQNVCA